MASRIPHVSIETITPEKAKHYLSLNTGNRHVTERTVEQYADDLRNGRWKFNGDAIRVSTTRLLDGQHRLLAILATGLPIESIVVTGLDEEVFETIDAGRKRTGADVLSIAGETNTYTISAALRQVWLYKNHQVVKQEVNFSNSMVLQELEAHPGLRESVRFVTSFRSTRILPHGIGAAYHYLFSYVNGNTADAFFKGLYTGEMLPSTSPIYHLRNRFLESIGANASQSSKYGLMRQPVRVALLIKAFNNYFESRPTHVLRWSSNERFPEINALPPEAVIQAT